MTHLKVHPIVRVSVTSTDSALLDSLEAEFPAADDPAVGPEYEGPTRIADSSELADGEERLVARVSYAVDEDSPAKALYDALTGYDLSGSTYEIRLYESPTGGVTADAVRAYYEQNPGDQPIDADGETYVPPSWDPNQHVVDETSG